MEYVYYIGLVISVLWMSWMIFNINTHCGWGVILYKLVPFIGVGMLVIGALCQEGFVIQIQ